MDDLISRQAAIKWCRPEDWGTPDERWRPESEYGAMLKALPSAQQWILCNDRLPFAEYGESKSVLACLENGTMIVLYFDGGNWCYPTGEPYIGINRENGWHNRVVAWMPLPEPYNEKNNE